MPRSLVALPDEVHHGAASFETGWRLHGSEAVVLANRRLRVTVLPGVGGKIWEVLDLATGVQHLWHSRRIKPKPTAIGAAYDDHFSGGWDELFPNDIVELLADETYPDHGELWTGEWCWRDRSDRDTARLELSFETPISGCRVSRTIELGAADRHLTIDAGITNLTDRDQPFLWKQHLALPALPGSIISVPATAGIVGDFGSLRPGSPGQTFAWPCPERNGTTIDLSRVPPPSSGIAELMYLATPDAGWCALTRPGGEGLALAYDQSVFPSCWVFASYGAWRGLSVLVLEPCTGYPMSVNRGVDQGTHRVLAAGDTVRTRLALIPFDGLASVKSVDQRDGIWIVTGPPQARGDAYDEPHGGEG